jgi:hypothetical protein
MVAKTVKSSVELESELHNIDFPFEHPRAGAFIQEVMGRFQGTSKLHLFSEYELDERRKAEQQKRNREFSTLEASDKEIVEGEELIKKVKRTQEEEILDDVKDR